MHQKVHIKIETLLLVAQILREAALNINVCELSLGVQMYCPNAAVDSLRHISNDFTWLLFFQQKAP